MVLFFGKPGNVPMPDDLYSVVLLFDGCDEAVRAGVRAFLEKRYRIPPKHMDTALDKGRLLIKRDCILSDAQAIRQRIRIVGAVCQLKKQPQHPNNTAESPNGDIPVSRGPFESDGTIICPKCQIRQPACAECVSCGIIFDKIHHHPAPRKNHTELAATPENRPVVRNVANPFKAFAAVYLPSFQTLCSHLSPPRQKALAWLQKPLNALFSCCVMLLTAVLLETFFIFLLKYLWFIYTATSVGERFIALHGTAAGVIEHIVATGLFLLAWKVVLLVLTVCLLIAYATQLTHISRFFLDSGGFLIKVAWIFPSALAAAWILWGEDPALSYVAAVLLVLLPTMLLLPVCLHLSRATLPEIGAVLSEVIKAARRRDDIIAVLKKRFQAAGQVKRHDAKHRNPTAGRRRSL